MKKIIIVLIAVLATAANINAQSLTYPVAINATNFPDQYFRAWVAGTSVDKNADGYLSQAEAKAVTEISSIDNYDKVTTYRGIEYFSQLTTFNSGTPAGAITNIDLSQNTLLKYVTLRFSWMQFSNPNAPSTLNFSNNTALKNLEISSNGSLTALDLRNCNSLTDLTIRSCPSLSSLNLNKGSLRSLLLSGTKFPTLDFSSFTSLSSLTVVDDRLKQLKLPSAGTIGELYIGRARQDAATGYGGCPSLDNIINLNSQTRLGYLYICKTSLHAIDLSNLIRLSSLIIEDNKNLTTLDITQNINLQGELDLNLNNLTELDLRHLTNVTRLDCSHNLLTSLKVPSSLTYIRCSNNCLTSLDLSSCTDLTLNGIDFKYNQIIESDSLILRQGISGWITYSGTSPQYDIKHRPIIVTGEFRDELNVAFNGDSNDEIRLHHPLDSWHIQDEYFTNPYEERDNHTRGGSGTLDPIQNPVTFESNGIDYVRIGRVNSDFDRLYLYTDYLHFAPYMYTQANKYFSAVVGKVRIISPIIPFFSLYLSPLSINTNNVYTSTMCLPWAVDIPDDEGIKVYVATGITKASEEEGQLLLQEITTGKIPANTPVVVTSTLPGAHIFELSIRRNYFAFKEQNMMYSNSGNSTSYDVLMYEAPENIYPSNILRGSWYETETVTPYSILTLGRRTDDGSGKIGFWNYKGNKTGLFRCYVPNESIPSAMMSPKFRGLSFKFPDEEDALTSIDAVPVERATIDARTVCYDLQGRRVSHPQRGGVYIINGKKVIF